MRKKKASCRNRSFPKLNLWIDIILLLVFLLVFESHATGISIHEWLGLIILAGVVVHILLHWRWITCAFSRFIKKLRFETRLKLMVDILIFIGFTSIFLSGLIISTVIMPALGFQVIHNPFWRWLHGFSVDLTLWLVALHIALSWKWIVKHFGKYIAEPIKGFFKKPELIGYQNSYGQVSNSRFKESKYKASDNRIFSRIYFYVSRTLIILFFAGLLSIGWYGISTSSFASTFSQKSRVENRSDVEANNHGRRHNSQGEFRGNRRERNHDTFSPGRAVSGMGKNLLILSLVIIPLIMIRSKLKKNTHIT